MKKSSTDTFRIVDEEPRVVRRIADSAMSLVTRAGLFDFDPGEMDTVARRTTGLADLRPEEIREPLELICEDIRRNPPSPLGRAMMFAIFAHALSSRRRLQHHDGPKAPNEAPVVIMGWYRTGTTFLQTLLGSLPGASYVPLHELVDPVPVAASRPLSELSSRWAHYLEPDMGKLHETNSMTPEECWVLLGQHLILDGMTYMYPLPTYREWLETADRLPAYRAWARAGAVLERRRNARLILKDPAHMRGLHELLTVTPGAKLIWTHRDPRSAVASHASLVAVQHRLMYGELEELETGRACVDGIARYFASARKAREEIGDEPFIDIHFKDLKDDPIGTVERICDETGLTFDAASLEAVIARRAKKRKPRHARDLSQWGVDPDEIEEFY